MSRPQDLTIPPRRVATGRWLTGGRWRGRDGRHAGGPGRASGLRGLAVSPDGAGPADSRAAGADQTQSAPASCLCVLAAFVIRAAFLRQTLRNDGAMRRLLAPRPYMGKRFSSAPLPMSAPRKTASRWCADRPSELRIVSPRTPPDRGRTWGGHLFKLHGDSQLRENGHPRGEGGRTHRRVGAREDVGPGRRCGIPGNLADAHPGAWGQSAIGNRQSEIGNALSPPRPADRP